MLKGKLSPYFIISAVYHKGVINDISKIDGYIERVIPEYLQRGKNSIPILHRAGGGTL